MTAFIQARSTLTSKIIVTHSEKRDQWNSSNGQRSVKLNFLQFSVSPSIWIWFFGMLRLHICGISWIPILHNLLAVFWKEVSIHTENSVLMKNCQRSLFLEQVTHYQKLCTVYNTKLIATHYLCTNYIAKVWLWEFPANFHQILPLAKLLTGKVACTIT